MIAAVLMLLVSLEGQTPQHRRFMQPSLPGRSLTCISCTCSDSTNYAMRSQALENAVWVKYQNLAVAPTVTASDGSPTYADPAGGFNAQRVQFQSCATGNAQSIVYQQLSGVPIGNASASFYIKPFSGSGTLSVSLSIHNGITVVSTTPCTTTGDWVRCSATGLTATGTPYLWIGCDNNNVVPGSNTGAADLLVYQGQLEPGTAPTCPINTTASTVARVGACVAVCR